MHPCILLLHSTQAELDSQVWSGVRQKVLVESQKIPRDPSETFHTRSIQLFQRPSKRLPPRCLPTYVWTPSKYVSYTFQTCSKHLPYNFQRPSNTFQTPSRHLSNTFQIQSKHLPNTVRTPRHLPETIKTSSRYLLGTFKTPSRHPSYLKDSLAFFI